MSKSLEKKAREMQAEYQRKWRQKNPGKTAEYMRRYWAKKAAELEAAESEKGND